MDLATRYLGLPLSNPLVVASSGLTSSKEGVVRCTEAGAGAVVLKSLFEEQVLSETDQLVGSDGHFVHPEAADYLKRHGQEHSVEKALELIREAKAAVSIPVIASLHCTSAGTWLDFAQRMEKAGADALELNVHVLTSDTRLSGAEMEQLHFDIATEVRKAVRIPVALKLGSQHSGLANLLSRLSRTGIQGLTLFNRSLSLDFDIETLELTASKRLSSPEEHGLTLRWISIASGLAGCDLAASTGVHDGKTAIKMLLAGATTVQLASALYLNGPELLQVMLADIKAWMERHGFERLSDFRGKLRQAASSNPAAYERGQFLRLSESTR
ncbi:MAG: dihydroorotate dehydrogenase-like protein [Myxococcales bacterium]|jgi:dihydroorotate dehydrogenase (fumarate)